MRLRRHLPLPGHGVPAEPAGRVGVSSGVDDWQGWLRRIERKRRLRSRHRAVDPRPLPTAFLEEITFSSFRLDEIEVTETQIAEAIAHGARSHAFRTRLAQRIRNHISILRQIELLVRQGAILVTETVIRWYTSISCGLSTEPLDEATVHRLSEVVRQVNSPQLRLQAAMTDIARLHTQLIADPFFPSFNGILARLLLQFHLGRCGLPPVRFERRPDKKAANDEHRLLRSLLDMVEASYATLLETA